MSEEFFLEEEVSCEYCNRVLKVKDEKPWLKIVEIIRDWQSDSYCFCSYECLGKWLSESDYSALQRTVAKYEDEKWRKQEKEIRGGS